MKLAYVTTHDPEDINSWSGLVTNIRDALRMTSIDIKVIGNLKEQAPRYQKIKKEFYQRFYNCKYRYDRHPVVLKGFTREIQERIKDSEIDIIFSPGSIPVSMLKTEIPIVFWTDATFAGMLGFYQGFSTFCKETIRNGNKQEQAALNNCSLAIYASDWAAKTALKYYDVDPDKVKVVPFGANMQCDRNEEDIVVLLNKKINFEPLKLLFIGKDWKRKGGDKALRVAELLNQKGIRTELDIVGCSPGIELPDFVNSHGFISKQTAEGRALLDQLFSQAHFFILPSEAEAFGVVFAEASSFGLPSLATDVGGIPTVIRDGINGKTFPVEASALDYYSYISGVIMDSDSYKGLALSSFREYQERLNWKKSGEKIIEDLTQFCH